MNAFFKPSIVQLFWFLVIVLALQSCDDPDRPGTWKNEQIKADKKEDFHKLNDQLFADLKDDKPELLENIMSKEMFENGYRKKQVEVLSPHCKSGSYTILDEYNIINKYPGTYTVNSNSGINNYSLNYQSPTREVYIAFLIPKSTADKWLITAMYCNYDYGWKLNKLSIDKYTLAGKTAPELFKLAKQKYDKAYLVDAVNAMDLAGKCSHPSEMWTYPEVQDMDMFYAKIIKEANMQYRFPLTLTQVPTQPKIFRIFNQTMPDGIIPTIYYLSRIKLNDTVALKNENENIKKVIGKILPGIDKDKNHLLFSAFNELPNAEKSVPSYDIMDKLL